MSNSAKYPIIYEINTWTWLQNLSVKYNREINLLQVPSQEWDKLTLFGAHAIWLMGIWERSPKGIEIALSNEGMMKGFKSILPDFTIEDVAGSPFCVRKYSVDAHLGGDEGLISARKELSRRGLMLILDHVPNHVAPDHPWTQSHPEFFIQADMQALFNNPDDYLKSGNHVYARGRDPYFPPWPDVIQLNAFSEGLRKATLDTLKEIASKCDGVRCDMAMLLVNRIFEKTWGTQAGIMPDEEFWPRIIAQVKKAYPHFLFIGEVYWDMEWEMQQQGFDFCYDKRLYDRLEKENAESVWFHLSAELSYQKKMVRFLENHDEPRAEVTFPNEKHKPAAVTTLTTPGIKLLHEGQMDGYKKRLPVFLARRPDDTADQEIKGFYNKLTGLLQKYNTLFQEGKWQLCERYGWPDNQSCLNLVAWCWEHHDEKLFIVVNLSEHTSQAMIKLPWPELQGKNWCLTEMLDQSVDYLRKGDQMLIQGIFIELLPWKTHFFSIRETKEIVI
jgi:glycosidase